MNAEIIAVGSELLTSQRVDTNSLFLTDGLNSIGVEVVTKCVVGDDLNRLTDAIRRAVARSEIVILSGGLGPTEDDLTRDAVAQALERKLIFHADIAEHLEQRFAQMKRKMAEVNRRQAFILDGAEILPNDRGTAPGQWIDEGDVQAAGDAAPRAQGTAAIDPDAGHARSRNGRVRPGPAHFAGVQKVRKP